MKRIITIIVALVAMASGTKVMAAEAYAVFTSGNSTLSFYYDDQRSDREGDKYSLNTGKNDPGWIADGKQFSKVVFAQSFANYRPTTTYKWFNGQSDLTTITNIQNLKTEDVTVMSYMFYGCSSLTSLDVSHFDTSNATSMSNMFCNCSSLTRLDLSNFDTSKVTDMRLMFYECSSLTSLDVSNFDTSKVTDMKYMFYNCSKLTSLDVSNFDTSKVTGMSYMFHGCSSLTSLDVSNFDTSKVTNMYSMFYGCSSLTRLDLSSFNTSNVTSMGDMFYNCSKLTSLDLSNFDTSNVTDMRYMFDSCKSLTSLDLSNFDTSNVTNMNQMFRNCSSLASLDLSNFDTSNVTDMGYMFEGCSKLTTVYVGSEWSTDKVTSSNNMFKNCTAIKGDKGTTYDASHTDASYAHIDGGTANPGYFSRGTHAYAVSDNGILSFYYDNKRNVRTGTTYDVVRGEQAWIDVQGSITKVVFDESFQEARPTSTFSWFRSMSALTEITGIENLNTSEVDNMENMFFECTKLTSLDLSSFNTEKVTGMRFMFYGCSNLTSLDLSSFNTRNVTTMGSMFSECSLLKTVYVGSGWTTESLKLNLAMFTDCTSLVGGQGTTFDSNYTKKEYAHIDGGTVDPGYFSVKKYDLWVSGQQVKLTNQTDVLGDGKVSYDPDTKTLTLNNATIMNTTANSTELEISEKSGLYCGSLPDLTINAVGNNTVESTNYLGLYFMNNVTITGSGSLSLKGKTGGINGAYARTGTLTVEGGVQLTVEATGANSYGIEGAYNKSKYLKTMVVNGANTVVKAKGAYCSIGKLSALQLNDGLEIVSPADCSFSGNSVQDANGVCNDWVTIAAPAGVVTGIGEAFNGEASPLNDNGQMINDQAREWYSLDGRRVLTPQKGHIYIRGGKKVVF